jgi:hypothetical protein
VLAKQNDAKQNDLDNKKSNINEVERKTQDIAHTQIRKKGPFTLFFSRKIKRLARCEEESNLLEKSTCSSVHRVRPWNMIDAHPT